MSRCIYEIIYTPWENNTIGRPWIYSGSDYYNNPNYLGSPSSKTIHDWTNGLTAAEWWKHESKTQPHLFKKIVLLEVGDHVSREELQSLESAIQTKENHRMDNRYFNKTNKHFNSPIQQSPLKGMTYEEIYGETKSIELKQSRSNTSKKTREMKSWIGFNGSEENRRNLSNGVQTYWDNISEEEKKSRGKAMSDGRKRTGYTGKGEQNPMYGRSAVSEKNLKWYTNGVDVIYVTENTQPEGYVRGRKLK